MISDRSFAVYSIKKIVGVFGKGMEGDRSLERQIEEKAERSVLLQECIIYEVRILIVFKKYYGLQESHIKTSDQKCKVHQNQMRI